MPDAHELLREVYGAPGVDVAPVTRVSLEDLSRLPAQRLARLLLERAAEDPTLLGRLYESVDTRQVSPGKANPFADAGAAILAGASMAAGGSSAMVVGGSAAMRQVAALVERFEKTDEPVLITGESGTGKELLARAIHDGSRRSNGPFVALNCAAIPSGLVASELFGFEKGAFTGAAARTLGQLEYAHGGTLFLDEIGDMPVDLQGHLLRFLQEGQIRRVGGRDLINLNIRIVAATNVQLRQAISAGRFREDLFYRLNVLTLPVPPLRDRQEDIPLLARHFLAVASRDFGRGVEGFSRDAMATLLRYQWPGNVRELMSVVRRAVVIADGPEVNAASLHGLDERFLAPTVPIPDEAAPVDASPAVMPRPGSPEERAVLLAALERLNENVTATADALGVSRVTLYRMLRRHGIVLKRGLAEGPVPRRVQHAHT